MFVYPKQAELNRVVAKTKIFAHAKPSRRIKDLFASQVEQIVWKYKLAPETINLPAKDGFTEIQVFEIHLKTDDLDKDVLSTIDKAIPFPILFQVVSADRIQFHAAYKRPSEADLTKWVVEARFHSPWQPQETARQSLPVALDLLSLYERLVRQHLPLQSRPAEGIRDHIARWNAIQAKEKECQQLEARLNKEKQFNRKVELNAALRSLRQELESLYL